MICGFIDAMRADRHRVEPTCQALNLLGLQVAPRSYRATKHRPPAARTVDDAAVIDKLRWLRTAGPKAGPLPETLYGRRKMTRWLARNGFPGISKHTVDRLMRQEGLRGLVRGRKVRTTIPSKDGRRAGDLLNRDFRTDAPNRAWVTDFTFVATWSGFAYVAFAIDLYSRAVVGWSVSSVKDVGFVETCLKMALWRRDHTGRPVTAGLIHHSDAGSQYTSIRFTETLALEGLSASIGTVGDAYDNSVAESFMGLFKNEAVAAGSPFRTGPLATAGDVEALTMHYIDWYNNQRLHSLLDLATPEEFETAYYATTRAVSAGAAPNKKPA
jgi:putative transposase